MTYVYLLGLYSRKMNLLYDFLNNMLWGDSAAILLVCRCAFGVNRVVTDAIIQSCATCGPRRCLVRHAWYCLWSWNGVL